jgi:16S rRNA (cytosine967-C5)-methyltransferase
VFPDPAADLAGNLAVRWAHPAWLVGRWLARHGEAGTRSLLEVGVSRPPLSLRAPPGGRDPLLLDLERAGVTARAGEAPDEVVVDAGDATAIAAVREGRAAVQDGTAQRVAPLLDVRPGDRVLDLCAAPGGKARHLLDLLGGRGEVVAADVSPEKVETLATALASVAAPGGLVARAVLVPAEGPLPFPPASFHGVLVDAPCTNTGVLRRRPEVRLRLRERDVAGLSAAQRALLERAWPLVRPGGRLVYATCSVEPEENEGNAAAFVAAHPEAVREAGFDVLPARDHDGGFAATIRRA